MNDELPAEPFDDGTTAMPGTTRRRFLAAGLAATAIPIMGRAEAQSNGFRVITLKEGEARLRGASVPATPIWGFDGAVPGPALRVKRGGEMKVRVVNKLAQPTAVHWHGIRIDNRMDGAAGLTQPPILPGESFDYVFTAPDAGTFWYHPHLNASEQLGRGLYGLLVVEETDPVEVDRDIAVLIGDWRLDRAGRIAEFGSMHDAAHAGRYGNQLTANGVAALDIPVRTNERLRLRLVNVANSRVMPVRVADHEATVMAIDGQPAEPFQLQRARYVLVPGGRCDLFVDATLAPGSITPIVIDTGEEEVSVARLVYGREPARGSLLAPARPLPANPLPAKMDFASALKLAAPLEGGAMSMMMGRGMMSGIMSGQIWMIASASSDGHLSAPLFSVKRGRTVMLAFPNRTTFPHAIHVHGHHFRQLDELDDGWKPWWLDSVLVLPNRTARIAFVADNPGKWMIHCHMIEHQETGMSVWFAVT